MHSPAKSCIPGILLCLLVTLLLLTGVVRGQEHCSPCKCEPSTPCDQLRQPSCSYVEGDYQLLPTNSGTVEQTCLIQIHGNLIIRGFGVSEVNLPNLRTLKGVLITDAHELTELRFPSLTTVEGDLHLRNVPELRELHTPLLTDLGKDLRVQYTGGGLDFPHLRQVRDIYLEQNHRLEHLHFPGLIAIRSLSLLVNTGLQEVSLENLQALSGGLTLSSNTLESLELPNLRTVTKDIILDWNTGLSALQLPELVHVGGVIHVLENHGLKSVDIFELLLITGEFHVRLNPDLTELVTPKLLQFQELDISRNPALQQLRFPGTVNIPRRLIIQDNENLRSVRFPKLQSTPDLDIRHNPILQEILFCNLREVEDHLRIEGPQIDSAMGFCGADVLPLFSLTIDTPKLCCDFWDNVPAIQRIGGIKRLPWPAKCSTGKCYAPFCCSGDGMELETGN